jgi:hypothetical protein
LIVGRHVPVRALFAQKVAKHGGRGVRSLQGPEVNGIVAQSWLKVAGCLWMLGGDCRDDENFHSGSTFKFLSFATSEYVVRKLRVAQHATLKKQANGY